MATVPWFMKMPMPPPHRGVVLPPIWLSVIVTLWLSEKPVQIPPPQVPD